MSDFDSQNGSPKPPKIKPKSTQDPLFFRLRFSAIFSSVVGRVFLDFRGAGPSFLLLFTAFPWGAPFFTKSEKVPKKTPYNDQRPPKMHPKTKPTK